MFDFAGLVSNENMKIYRRARVWIMWGLLAVLTLAISLITAATAPGKESMWPMLNIEIKVMIPLVNIFAVIIAADIVAGEFSSGTIKLLLIRPWSRAKILLSKYTSVLLFSFFSMLLLYALTLVVNLIVFGYDKGVKAAGIFSTTNPGLSAWSYVNQDFLLQFIALIVTVTLAFMISAVFRSSGLAIGLSLFIVLMGNSLAALLKLVGRKWTDYVLFENLDLTRYIGLGSNGTGDGMSLGFSLSVLAAYYVIFIALSWYVFVRRDVAA